MFCTKCGKQLEDNWTSCPYCGATVGKSDLDYERCEIKAQNDVNESSTIDAFIESEQSQTDVLHEEPVHMEEERKEQEAAPDSSLTGKKYEFISVKGTRMAMFRIISSVEVGEDRLFIDITPKRYNTSPAIFFEDVTGIDVVNSINHNYLVLIIVSVILGFFKPYLFICTVIFIYAGLQKKITISQRNGIKVIMYSRVRSKAVEFREDMKKIIKIR